MTQFGFYYDADNCIGCHSCQVACKDTNRLMVGENFRTVKTYCTGSGYTPGMYHISMACNHCAQPNCIPACPEGALVRNEEGLVVVDEQACTGCGDCLDACPYHAITMMAEGIVGKCDGCIDLRAQGEQPACVATCPQRVLELGDIEDLGRRHQGENLNPDAAPLGNASSVKPNLVMRIKDCMTDADYDEIVI